MNSGMTSGSGRPAQHMPPRMATPPAPTSRRVPLAVWIILGAAAIILIVFLALGLPSPAELMRGTEEYVPTPSVPTGAADDLPAIERDLGAIGIDNLDAELGDVEAELGR